MKHFEYMQASSAKEAAKNASKGDAMVIAGGVDLLGTLKDEILPHYPSVVVDLKTIPGLDEIKEDNGVFSIGALTKLAAIVDHEGIKKSCTALNSACERTASPTIRHMSTLGGNICQMHRCWYFRVPDMRFNCIRKGGKQCPAMIGDNRYHSIYGDQNGCYAASPHDTAPALIALGATIVTTKRKIPVEEFFEANGVKSHVLEDGEVVTEILVPKAKKSCYQKFALRKSIDFPIVNCAAAIGEDDTVKIALGGVYPSPFRVTAAEEKVAKGINEQSAVAAADAAVADCKPLSKNEYKVEVTRAMVRRALLGLLD